MSHRLVRLVAGVAVAAVAAALAGCTAGGTTGGSSSDLDAALAKGGTITYWTWTPSAKAQVAAFEKAYPKVHVKLVNAGTSNDEYTKLQNTVKAGTGAPDVAQVEYYALPQFSLSGALLDLTPYGFGDLKGSYGAGTWQSVEVAGKIYGLPQDSGPMALFYNKPVFDKAGITSPPVTWDDYLADAKKVRALGPDTYITSDNGDAGFTTSLIWQAGGHPFQSTGDKVKVNLQDAGTKKWTAVWNQLISDDLLSPTPGFSDDWFRQLGTGQIASLVTGAWMTGVLEASVENGSGDWRVAPMPTYDGVTPVTANSGGSAQSVLKQSKNPALAAAFLKWLNSSKSSIGVFLDKGGFPATAADLDSPSFTGEKPDYFAGQSINETLSAASKAVAPDWQYLPFQVYANSVYSDTVGQAYLDKSDLNAGLKAWQDAIVKYGKDQGFTVTVK